MVFYQSSPLMIRNHIVNNLAPGILSMSSSFPLMNIEKSGNEVANNRHDLDDNDAEILVKDISFPVMDNGHNDIIDDQGGYLIYGDEDMRLRWLYIRNNYWGTKDEDEIQSRLLRAGGFIISPIDENPNFTGMGEEPLELMFTRAFTAESDSNYVFAESIYDSVITLYPGTVYSITALDRQFYAKRKAGRTWQDIEMYFEGLTAHADEGIAHIAKRLKLRCNTRQEDYASAIHGHEQWKDEAEYLCDSVYSVVDIMTNELLQSGGRIGKSTGNSFMKLNQSRNDLLAYKKNSDDELSALISGRKTKTASLPQVFHLNQNYPNPFNPSTTIRYQLPAASKVSVKIYNILGQEVLTLVNKQQAAGYYSLNWNGKNSQGCQVTSGVYIYRLVAKSADKTFMQSKKMMLIK